MSLQLYDIVGDGDGDDDDDDDEDVWKRDEKLETAAWWVFIWDCWLTMPMSFFLSLVFQ